MSTVPVETAERRRRPHCPFVRTVDAHTVHRVHEFPQQPQRRFVRQALQSQARAAGMIHDGQRAMRLAMPIRLRQEIASPDPIAWDGSGDSVFQLPSCFINQILVPSAQIRDIGLAHRHVPPDRPAPIEVMGNGSAAHLRHPRLQPNDFLAHPLRFRLCADCLRPHWLPCPRPSSW